MRTAGKQAAQYVIQRWPRMFTDHKTVSYVNTGMLVAYA